ncbi:MULTISPECIES: DEAD/DEAH box helicase [Streptomyces]|uniref:ATP-dependent helicase n=2 Tax=Streptomyces TaxID=1883 RepID=O86686_STRCO|nr:MULTISPECIES: DEAD/DEAH box helicase [Streptomyces]MDX2923714.1 DEAD/DEAH box helicase [Streptomyces sp. NRRL_B-16638]MDX3405597.1 DEAD/DEAH box helicase [Streptomyces sp. ME02-6977A]MYU46143.1 DEAD/DEAH box helicase [Streptomyces sp. SID7813]NSL78438.1 DEAD/DEAH box helicase [Streptomyces coelicolor]QFI46432.1 DEAD/DEAH box helicase [Streptomyces coelicolor A3(2)]
MADADSSPETEGADVLDRLDPVVLHHIVNTLGWSDLRPLQRAAITPLMEGEDAVLLAPTAGGKTEAACFPLLSAMAEQKWTGTSVLYLCPLKALLNNLVSRVDTYTQWLGRRAALWHGDTKESQRQRIRTEAPDVLLTTPESLEAMLIGVKTDHARLLGSVRAVVVDEVHAFAGDDRGWHLLAVLERLEQVTGRPIQRIGLSATVGNPDQLLDWLQGAGVETRAGRVVAPGVTLPAFEAVGSDRKPTAEEVPRPAGEVELDYVGSLDNAAKLIATLHRGEKRLVFCDSRAQVEQLGAALRAREVTVFLSHASLSVDERTRSEQAFAEARDCVIVSTSTLELGIDVGDLDRVIQIDSPATVASFLQRIGRTGRRAGTVRNCLFLTTRKDTLLQAAGLLLLWSRGWVEPVKPPPEPRHLVAQQLLAVTLQQHKLGDQLWDRQWNGLAPFDQSAAPILRHLTEEGFLDSDGGLLFVGPEAERRFGKRHFIELTASFTAPPQFTVLSGRTEIGRTDPSVLTEERPGPRRLLLGGRSWQVTYIDWLRKRVFVEPADSGGIAKWMNGGIAGLTYALTRAMREVMLGEDPPVVLTRRAQARLAEQRESDAPDTVHPDGTLVTRAGNDVRWWTWAGYRANATLAATLQSVTDPLQRPTDCWLRLREDLDPADWHAARKSVGESLVLPDVDPRAVRGLKFSAALPERLAIATVAARLADFDSAWFVLSEAVRFVVSSDRA